MILQAPEANQQRRPFVSDNREEGLYSRLSHSAPSVGSAHFVSTVIQTPSLLTEEVYFLAPPAIRTEGDRLIACSLYPAPLHVFWDLIKEAKLVRKCCVCLSSEKNWLLQTFSSQRAVAPPSPKRVYALVSISDSLKPQRREKLQRGMELAL